MERITNEEVMDKLNMCQAIFGKIDEFGWWYFEIISTYAGTQLTSNEFQYECQTRSVWLVLVALEHQEMNGKFESTQRKLCTIAHSRMVHAQVLEGYIDFALMHISDHISPVLNTKDLRNEDINPTTQFKFEIGTKSSISHVRVLCCTCVVLKATVHVATKASNMRHQVQKGYQGIFFGIPHHQKGYLVC